MVQVMSPSPPPDHVQWYMNGSMVKPSDLYLISNISVSDASTVPITYNASLTISSVNLTTQGFYWASFYGHVGVVNTTSIFVTPPGRQWCLCIIGHFHRCVTYFVSYDDYTEKPDHHCTNLFGPLLYFIVGGGLIIFHPLLHPSVSPTYTRGRCYIIFLYILLWEGSHNFSSCIYILSHPLYHCLWGGGGG